ncbi:MAG: oxygen-dependent protoporphyrinogen oxidase [Planctomycetota bacterium]|jgi:oxygen-dependent protoporphyrinogen oxidase
MDADVLIIGGGPAGLAAAAWELQGTSHPRVTVLEASSRPGGWLRSERRDGYLCEHGPQAIRSSPEFMEFVAKLGCEDDLVAANPKASTRWLGRRGKLRAVPTKPLAMLGTRLLSPWGKFRVLREPRVATRPSTTGGESVAAFCERRFGREAVPLVQAMIGGIFAGDASKLEVESALPSLTAFEECHGSVVLGLRAKRKERRARGEGRPAAEVYSFRDGIEGLVNRMVALAGDSLEVDAPVESVSYEGGSWIAHLKDGSKRTAARLVLACPARVSATLLRDTAPDLAAELAAIPFASLASVYLGVPTASPPAKLSGFGFLLETEPDTPVLGAIYASQLFPDHAPAGHQLIRVMMGGSLHPNVTRCESADLIAMAVATLQRYVGRDLVPDFTHVVRCREAIPQYQLGHKQRMHRINDLLAQTPELRLCGNSYQGIAVTSQLGRDAGLRAASDQANAQASEQASKAGAR